MNSNQFKRNICRICLTDNVCLDWNTPLYEFYDTTYKDCYYKYSQLERYERDPFPQMLCQDCSNSLHNTHLLILKAIESQKLLQNEFEFNDQFENELKSTRNSVVGDVNFIPAEFETVLVERVEIEPIIDDHLKCNQNFDEIIVASNVLSKTNQQTKNMSIEASGKMKSKVTTHSVRTANKIKELLKDPSIKSIEIHTSPAQAHTKCTTRIKREKTVEDDNYNGSIMDNNRTENYSLEIHTLPAQVETKRPTRIKRETIVEDDNYEIVIEAKTDKKENTVKCESIKHNVSYSNDEKEEDEIPKAESNVNKKFREVDEPRMCSMCSKILRNKYAVQMHEKTHMENRERKETCKVCGLKFYDKRNLYSHMRIHKENREKRHKCDFCSKAFYDKGGLNIHRRIHLGQMVPCSLCSKQFYRQIDLDRHMSSHSATAINVDTKKRSKYFVRCHHCDKSLLSTSFKSHIAAHLNDPLMKCLICGKEYFRRKSCVLHVKKIHQKTNEEYKDFIVTYKKNRISHLYLEQKADILHNND